MTPSGKKFFSRIYILPVATFMLFSLTRCQEKSNQSISIHEAAKIGDIRAVKKFISSGGDINVKLNDELTPLMIASSWCHEETVKLLLSHKAKVNESTIEGLTALHMTIFYSGYNKGSPRHNLSCANVARVLIENGANVNAKSRNGGTPLLLATIRVPYADTPDSKHLESVRLRMVGMLFDKGADINVKDT